MTPTTLTNLALSKIGHTLVKALGDTTSKEARLASLHYEPCLREALRAHFWSFAMTTRPLAAVDVREYLTVTGPLKVGGTSVTFPRLYRQEDKVNGKAAFSEDQEEDSADAPSTATWNGTRWELAHAPTDGLWIREIDKDSPELTTLRPESPDHTLTTNLAGENNDLVFTQTDPTLPALSVEYSTPADTHLTTWTSNGRALLYTPGTRARMIITGADSGVNLILRYAGYLDKPHWTSNGMFMGLGIGTVVLLYHVGGKWRVEKRTGSTPEYIAETVDSSEDYPHGLSFSSVLMGTLPPTVAAGVSMASQIAQPLVPGLSSAFGFVTIAHKAGSNGTGAVSAMPRTSLSGGVTGTPVIKRLDPATEIHGWTHAYELPADFIKAKTLWSATCGRKIDRFAIRRVAGKTCLLCNEEDAILEYVHYIDDPTAFDPLFVKAFTTLLAAKLGRAISGSDDIEARFLEIFEKVDLPAARTASGQETDSDENHPLRQLLDGNLTKGRGDFFGRFPRM